MWVAVILAVICGAIMLEADAQGARFVLGAAVGALSALVFRMHSRLQRQAKWILSLERRLDERPAAGDAAEAHRLPDNEPAIAAPSPTRPQIRPYPHGPSPKVAKAGKSSETSARLNVPEPGHDPAPSKTAPAYGERALRWLQRWLTTGNVPVKVGVLISFFGVSFLLKYAAEQQYLTLPIEVRLLAVGAAALGALAFGWHQRGHRPGFALSLQGGAIGVLFLTVFAAFQLYHLLPALAAFALLVAFTIAAGVLAVLQNAMALAVLGVVGGFLAPVLIATGSGNHVALFSYYAVLNGAVFGVAWFRPWRVLNLIGFVFTFIIATAWGYQYYRAEYFASVEPFLVLFFLMYLGISMAYALGQSIRLRSYVDASLVFGLPLVAFALQAQLVVDFEYGTAISALVLAMVYLACAWVLLRSHLRDRIRLLGESFLALGVGFATLAVPLAFTADWTALTWALEGAAMVWLGTRQTRELSTAAGVALQCLAGAALLYALMETGRGGDWLFINDKVLGGVALALAGLASARWLEPWGEWCKGAGSTVTWLLFGWGLMWWFATLGQDIARVVSSDWQLSSWLLLLVATAALMGWGQTRLHWHKIQVALSGYLPVVLLTAVGGLDSGHGEHYWQWGGWLAWPLALAMLAVVFLGTGNLLDSARPWQRSMTVWLLALLLVRQAHWFTGVILAEGVWHYAVIPATAVAMHLTVWQLWRRERFSVHCHSRDWSLQGMGPVLGLALTASVAWLLVDSGEPAPLLYLPLLNPLSLAAIAVALAAVHWLYINKLTDRTLGETSVRHWMWGALAVFALVVITGDVARSVHHWSGVPFRVDALFQSVRVQASLSVVWALSALAVMVFGHRRVQRAVYLCGAGLMAVVVAKLFLVDLAQSGTLERIVSFIGVGLLLLVVGFLAPVPPRRRRQNCA